MTFKAKEPEPISGQDCKNFKPRFFDKSCCRLAGECNYAEQDFIEVGRFGEYCQGIKWDSVIGNPPKVRP